MVVSTNDTSQEEHDGFYMCNLLTCVIGGNYNQLLQANKNGAINGYITPIRLQARDFKMDTINQNINRAIHAIKHNGLQLQ